VIQAQDSWAPDRVDAKPVTITVAPTALAVSTTSLANGVYQLAYVAALSATGGTGATTWALVGGALPQGLSLDAGGMLSGVPTSVGTFTVAVQAMDANWPGNVASATLTLTVSPPAFAVAIAPTSTGRVGLPMEIVASSTGQIGSVSWSIASGVLPAGLALNAITGIIAGSPSVFGSFTVVVQARDSWNGRVAAAKTTIVVAPTPIAVVTTTLAPGSVHVAYTATLLSVGGTGATTWSIVSGALPAGLSMAASGVISGAPTAVGTATFTVQATDAGWPGNAATQVLTLTVGTREIVLYASDASAIAGTWSFVADATAAGGSRLWNADKGAAKLVTALASPVNYVEMTFQAEAGVAYHLWLRGKADANSWANDSVIAQFSGSTTATGAPVFRIGTTSGSDINLEDCSGCGISGWGWQDNGWGVNVFGPAIYFEQPGAQTIRIQVKEDGFSFDQVVLSANKYVTTAPGTLKNDATILPR
jgi:hypothetical protein